MGIASCAYCGSHVDADDAYQFDKNMPYRCEGCFYQFDKNMPYCCEGCFEAVAEYDNDNPDLDDAR